MNCKQVKTYLMTDYLDGQIKGELFEKIKAHLGGCQKCQEFEAVLKEKTVDPFKKAQTLKAPQELWAKVEEKITSKPKESWLINLQDSFAQTLSIPRPRPVFVLAILALFIFVSVLFVRIPFNRQDPVQDYFAEQIKFLSYLEEDTANGSFYLDTAIEDYFL